MASIIKRKYKVTTAAGSVIVKECLHWTIQYRDATGLIKRVKGYKDKGATRQLAARLERAVAHGETGLVDPFKAHKSRAIDQHVKEYVNDIKNGGRSDKYASNIKRRIEILIDDGGLEKLSDMDANAFLRWRENARKSPRKGTEKGKTSTSAETLNQYLEAGRSFLTWCVKTKRIAANPLLSVDKAEGEKARKRRGLTDDEVARLLAAAPADRKLVYRVGLSTGLRRSELEKLKWGDVGLNATKPYLQLRAEATKARRGDRLYLPQSLAGDLRTERGDNTDNDAVFRVVPPLKLWKVDLATAGILWTDSMGRKADFHGGTRKTLCNQMQRANIPLATAMRQMRHTDARLTMVDYTDDDQVALAEPMPEIVAKVATQPNTTEKAG